MAAKNDNSNGITVSPLVLIALLGGAGLGGGGAYGVLGPQLDRAALLSCVDNSRLALGVVADQSKELVVIREAIGDVRRGFDDQQRRNTDMAARAWIEQQQRDKDQDRRVMVLERQVDKIEDVK